MKRLSTLLLSGALATFAHGQVSVIVLEPASLEGGYDNTYCDSIAPAGWTNLPNMSLLTNAVTDTVAFAYDNDPVDDSLCCGEVANAVEVNGKIAVVYRGTTVGDDPCFFSLKALNCQNAGAVACIIINNIPGPPVVMGAGDFGADVTIPVFMITQDAGAIWRAEMEAGTTIVAYLGTTLGLFNNDVATYKADLLMPPSAAVPTLLAQNASEFSAPLGAWVRTNGSGDQTEVSLTVDVSQNGNSVWSGTGGPVSVPSGDSAFIEAGIFSLSSYSGQYDITYTVSIPSGDDFPLNNTLTTTLTFGDYFSYVGIDPATGAPHSTGGVAFGTPTGTYTSCAAFRDANASRVAVPGLHVYAARNAPNSLDGEILTVTAFQWDDEFTGLTDIAFDNVNAIASEDYIIVQDTTRWEGYIPFNAPVVLEDNVRYLFCVSTETIAADMAVFLGTSDDYDYDTNQEQNDQPTTPIQNAAAWNAGFAGTTGSIGVKMLDAAIGFLENSENNQPPAYPNPAFNELRIPIKGLVGATQLRVFDTTGKLVSTQQLNPAASTLNVNTSGLTAGQYTFVLAAGTSPERSFKVVIGR